MQAYVFSRVLGSQLGVRDSTVWLFSLLIWLLSLYHLDILTCCLDILACHLAISTYHLVTPTYRVVIFTYRSIHCFIISLFICLSHFTKASSDGWSITESKSISVAESAIGQGKSKSGRPDSVRRTKMRVYRQTGCGKAHDVRMFIYGWIGNINLI